MNAYRKQVILMALWSIGMPAMAADRLSLADAIQRALQYRNELAVARLGTQRATLGLESVESQLGWQASAAAGWQHRLDTLGQPSEQQQLSAGLLKQQQSGNQISLQGSYQKDDSDVSGTSLFPNPAESYGLTLDYRVPLQKGRDNPNYAHAETQVQTSIAISQAEQQAVAERISEQVINAYHQLLNLQIQITENQRAIARTRKLAAYIAKNTQLGLAEEKDRLSVAARLAAQRADGRRLQRERAAQRVVLEKLIGNIPAAIRVGNYTAADNLPSTLDEVIRRVMQRDTVIASNKEKLTLNESLLRLKRDSQNDQLDVVMSLGNETRQGQRSGGTLDENEWTGGVRLEYQFPLDHRGVDAETRQAMLERDQLRLESQRYAEDLRNQLQQWYQEWQLMSETIVLYRQRKMIELQKHKEVRQRYLEGRTDIREMLEAEEALTLAEKLLSQEQARRSLVLALIVNRLGVFMADNG